MQTLLKSRRCTTAGVVFTTISTTAIFQNTEIRPFMYSLVRYQVATRNLSSSPIFTNIGEMTSLVRLGIFLCRTRLGWSAVMYSWDEGLGIMLSKIPQVCHELKLIFKGIGINTSVTRLSLWLVRLNWGFTADVTVTFTIYAIHGSRRHVMHAKTHTVGL